MAEQNETHFEIHSKNHDMKYQASKFDLAIKNARLLDILNLRLLVTNLTNILNERDKNQYKKYNYTYEEYSQDTRSFTVESDVRLTEEEIQDIALGCNLTDGYTYEGGEKGKRFKATFKGTEFGDDTQTEYGGDKTKEEEQ